MRRLNWLLLWGAVLVNAKFAVDAFAVGSMLEGLLWAAGTGVMAVLNLASRRLQKETARLRAEREAMEKEIAQMKEAVLRAMESGHDTRK